jgi:hypothetical protein
MRCKMFIKFPPWKSEIWEKARLQFSWDRGFVMPTKQQVKKNGATIEKKAGNVGLNKKCRNDYEWKPKQEKNAIDTK